MHPGLPLSIPLRECTQSMVHMRSRRRIERIAWVKPPYRVRRGLLARRLVRALHFVLGNPIACRYGGEYFLGVDGLVQLASQYSVLSIREIYREVIRSARRLQDSNVSCLYEVANELALYVFA